MLVTFLINSLTGDDTSDEWALEGRRLVPLMPRIAPQTIYTVIADEEANRVSIENEKLPLPASTDRKRHLQSNFFESCNKNIHFHVSSESTSKISIQNNDEITTKKRKHNCNVESSSLAQHLIMGQQKANKVQLLNRQKTKTHLKSKTKSRSQTSTNVNRNLNIIITEGKEEEISIPKLSLVENKTVVTTTSTCSISNEFESKLNFETSAAKIVTQSTNNLTNIQQTHIVSESTEIIQKPVKICKIIVTSTSNITTPSILQRTLTIPFVKTLSMKNLDKIKLDLQNTSGTVPNTISNVKPKLLTVQTKLQKSTSKHVNIPFIQGVQLQALQNNIKVVPFSSKSTAKSNPLYIVNAGTTLPTITTSNIAPVVSSKIEIKNEENINTTSLNDNSLEQQNKSSILADIMEASGVFSTDDIESQITQLTEIPTNTISEITTNNPIKNAKNLNEITITDRNEIKTYDSKIETIIQENNQDSVKIRKITTSPNIDYVLLEETEKETESTQLIEEEQINTADEIAGIVEGEIFPIKSQK